MQITNWMLFGLVLLGALMLWILGFLYLDTGAVVAMSLLVAVVGASLLQREKTVRKPPAPHWRQ